MTIRAKASKATRLTTTRRPRRVSRRPVGAGTRGGTGRTGRAADRISVGAKVGCSRVAVLIGASWAVREGHSNLCSIRTPVRFLPHPTHRVEDLEQIVRTGV